MRDVIKTERARKIINFLTGKVLRITVEDGSSTQKICSGIYGSGELPGIGQVCLKFNDYFKSDKGGPEGMQLAYKDWEDLIDKGFVNICDSIKIELNF